MKLTLIAAAAATLLTSTASFAGSLDPVVGDRIGVHKYNGCEVIIYAEPRTALFGLLSTDWDYTRAGRECVNELRGVDQDDGDDNRGGNGPDRDTGKGQEAGYDT